MRNLKRPLSIFLLAAIIASTSCGGPASGSNDTTTSSDTTTAAPVEEGYPYYGDTNLGGETFTVWNVAKDLFAMICVIQPDEVNGETVNDLIYNRNERVKQKLNFELEEVNGAYDTINTEFQTLMLAGDDTYDAFYMPMHQLKGGLTEGYFTCLNDVSTLHLDEPWWDQIMIESSSLANKTYFATSSAHLMGWDGLWCLFFNESMMTDLGLDFPYQLVRDGEWTLAKLSEYSKAAANLNGADSFTKDNVETGKSVFGTVSFNHVFMKFLFGLGADFVSKDKDDLPVITFNQEKFITTTQTLGKFISTPGEFLTADTEDHQDTCYLRYFENHRALFLGAEVKAAQRFRTMEQSFGIIPFPKLDENQENYRSTALHQVACFTIPVTNKAPEKIGLIFDALSYESDKTVLDPYFSVLVEQKGLRNEESIEMLNIIKDTRSFDLGVTYQWIGSLESALRSDIAKGAENVVSVIESNKTAVEESINKMLDQYNK